MPYTCSQTHNLMDTRYLYNILVYMLGLNTEIAQLSKKPPEHVSD